MKSLTNFLAITTAFIFLIQDIFSQEVNIDSVKAGRFYNVLLSNNRWMEGQILYSDSLTIKLKQSDGTVSKFSKMLVKSIIVPSNDEVKEYYSEKYSGEVKVTKPQLSLSGGFSLNSSESSGGFPSSYLIDLEGALYINRSTGIRLSVNCNFFNNKNYYYSNPYYFSYEEGGKISEYVITLDFLAGSLKPEQKTKQYFTCGLGVFIHSESEIKGYDSYGTYNYAGSHHTLPILKLGYGLSHSFSSRLSAGGELLYDSPYLLLTIGFFSIKPRLSYTLSKNFELFLEPQYTFGIGGFYASDGYFTIKSGVTLGSF